MRTINVASTNVRLKFRRPGSNVECLAWISKVRHPEFERFSGASRCWVRRMHKDVQDGQDVRHVQAVRVSDASASVADRVAGAGFGFEMAFLSGYSFAFCLSNWFSGCDD